MIRTEREKTRELRKLNILKAFVGNEVLFTNQVATKIKVVWPVADRLLQDMVEEKRLSGNKLDGYSVYVEPKKPSLFQRIKKALHA